jgi:hypothetical protein
MVECAAPVWGCLPNLLDWAVHLSPLEMEQSEAEVKFRFLWFRAATGCVQFRVGACLMKRRVGVSRHN